MSGLVGAFMAVVPGMDAEAANAVDETAFHERLEERAGELYEGKTWAELTMEQREVVLDSMTAKKK